MAKYYPVEENTIFSVEDVKGLLNQGWTHYRFPDGTCPKVLPIKGPKLEGMKLIFHAEMNQYMWIGLMAD